MNLNTPPVMNKIILCLVILITSISYSQNKALENYNLPPGAVLKQKGFEKIDYSYKLNGTIEVTATKVSTAEFIATFKKDIEFIKSNYPKDYEYYAEAERYFDGLSENVKHRFTANELNYIYIFDQKLKYMLANLK